MLFTVHKDFQTYWKKSCSSRILLLLMKSCLFLAAIKLQMMTVRPFFKDLLGHSYLYTGFGAILTKHLFSLQDGTHRSHKYACVEHLKKENYQGSTSPLVDWTLSNFHVILLAIGHQEWQYGRCIAPPRCTIASGWSFFGLGGGTQKSSTWPMSSNWFFI